MELLSEFYYYFHHNSSHRLPSHLGGDVKLSECGAKDSGKLPLDDIEHPGQIYVEG